MMIPMVDHDPEYLPRVALVGIGDAATHHSRALLALQGSREVNWAATIARSEEGYKNFCKRIEQEISTPLFSSVDSLITAHSNGDIKPIDGIILATPDNTHYEQVTQLISNNIAVLVEKPFVPTVQEAQHCIDVAIQNDTKLQVGYHLRYHAGHLALKKCLNGQKISDISLSWSWKDPNRSGWRADTANKSWAMAALGTHLVDLALWLSDSTFVDYETESSPTAGPDQTAELHGQLANGATVHIHTSVDETIPSHIEIKTANITAECTKTCGARGDGTITLSTPLRTGNLNFAPRHPYTEQLRTFVNTIHNGYVPDTSVIENVHILEKISTNRNLRKE